MEKLLGESGWFVLFGAVCYLLTLSIRKGVETAAPYLQEKPYKTIFSRWWNQVILYLIPLALGCLLALALRGTPIIFAGIEGMRAAAVYGTVVGSLSSMLYKVLKMLILNKAGIVVPEEEVAAVVKEIKE